MSTRRRLLLVLPTLAGLIVLVFSFLHLVPGDPVEIMLGEGAAPADLDAMRATLGLDRPPPEQFVHFVAGLLRGDLGQSIAFRAPVSHLIASRYPATLELGGAALLLAVVFAVPLGVLAATHRGGAIDVAARALGLLGICLPTLWLGPVLVLVFSMQLGWLPISGRGGLAHLVLPAVSLAAGMMGILVRLTRASVLAVLHEGYVLAARARGAPPWLVTWRHIVRTALLPIVTVVGLQAGALLAGAVVTETIFAWPGVGRLLVQAIGARDYPLVQGCVLAIGVTYVAINLATDVLLARLDARLRDAA
ncbi:MAG TPA: ABC transporter permease [Candidatus Limnocylindria bacterium]|nr:ABC transporter permease [Candidatus Limnocylindria bacterium]